MVDAPSTKAYPHRDKLNNVYHFYLFNMVQRGLVQI